MIDMSVNLKGPIDTSAICAAEKNTKIITIEMNIKPALFLARSSLSS